MSTLILAGRQVVYSVLQFGSRLLWDECYRKDYIGSIGEIKQQQGFEVYAFSVFNDRVYMLTGRFGEYTMSEACTDQMRILQHFLDKGKVPVSDLDLFENGSGIKVKICPMKSSRDVVRSVIHIHLVSMNLGYVRQAGDYWWSSVQTYRKRYTWKIVDLFPVLDAISFDRDHSRRVLLRKQGDMERGCNPTPACLRRGKTYGQNDLTPDASA